MTYGLRLILLMVIGLFFPSSGLLAQEPEAIRTYAEALRARSLFLLAEENFTRVLNHSRLSQEQQTEFTFQLSITLLEHGILENGGSRAELWERAQQSVQSLLKKSTDNPRQEELQAWLAILVAEQAAILGWEAGLSPEDETGSKQAQARLREAIAKLHVENERLSETANIKGATAVLHERSFLKQRNQWHLANCDLWLAELLPPGRERTVLLIDAANLSEQIGRIPQDNPYALKTTLLKARVARLQKEELVAERLLTMTMERAWDSVEGDAILSERIRLEIARQRLDTVFELLQVRLKESSLPSDELRAVIVHAVILAAEKARSSGKIMQEQEHLAGAQTQLGKISGRWKREAAIRLERARQNREFGDELAGIVRRAQTAWQSGQIDEAIQRYVDANQLAFNTGKSDQAFELGMTGASLLIQSERWEQAAKFLKQIRDQSPQHPRAAEADLLRCYALGRHDPSGADFQTGLQEHLQQYPTSPTRWDAARMLAVAAELANQPQEALKWYRQIPDDHVSRDEADARSLTLLLQLVKTASAGAFPKELIEQCGQQVERSVRRILANSEPWTPLQCRILLQSVQLLASPVLQGGEQADQLLEKIQQRIDVEKAAAARHQEPLSSEWKEIQQTTWQLRIVSLAARKRLDEARTLLLSFETNDTEMLLSMITGLHRLTEQFQSDQRYELGHLQLQVIRRLEEKRDSLSAEQKQWLILATAEARVAVNDWSGSITAYQTLHQADPRNQQIIKELIHVSRQQGLPADLERARSLWQQLERSASPGSVPWIESRLEQATILIQQKDHPAAKKIIGVMRTLYPQMGNAKLKSKSETLWQQVQ
ncbi:MAG TPA: hypothetical protein VNQ76_21840 [Planctomicrobium sp.]|nr:hypothetical protein [Planctomicrobium sp.]